MEYLKDDGGRLDAGFKGKTGDCVTRAIVIANNLKYRVTYNALTALTIQMTGGLKITVRNGCPTSVSHKFLIDLGWTLTLTHGQYLRDIPKKGTYIAALTRHLVCIIDHVVHDTWNSRRSRRTKDGSPKMLGYYSLTTS